MVQTDSQHQLRFGGVQTADWEVQKRNRHSTDALQGQSTQHIDEADPALWNDARRNCVFEGKKPRCQDGQEDTQAACSQSLTRVVSWKRQMSWPCFGAWIMLRIDIG